ncbi:phage tail sheath family protein [Desulfovibrio sp. OttesenSCG-928-G11]|nr:phage tail sheath family protein [Desulfovibrio sp. OttesenSCG-928-G11]
MSQTYRHGVYTREVPTSILPARHVMTNLPFVVGTAPVHLLDEGKPRYVNEPRLYYTYAEFVAEMGWSEDWNAYTLCEFVQSYTSLYAAAPFVVVNVFDPAVHQTEGAPDPAKVESLDIIGGIDPETLKAKGLELIAEVFPRYRQVPGCILAPKYSTDPAVAVVMGAKTSNINGLFQCMALADVDVDEVPLYTDVPGYKNQNNLTNERLVLCWPKIALGDRNYHLSTHLAGLISFVDDAAGGTPHVSPSNKQIQITRAIGKDGRELWLGLDQCNFLNGEGVHTVSNFDGGWRAWGNRTAAYPSNTDPKDAFIPIRRFFNWYQNTFILTYFQKVDSPLTRRFIRTILDSEQIRLDGYTAQEVILGGRISFDSTENPVTDLIDGLARFHIHITPPPPARVIEGIFEFDPFYVETLFE